MCWYVCLCACANSSRCEPSVNEMYPLCILCLRAYYLDNNIHISSHLQSFITALWALSFTLSHYLSLPFSLAHTLIHTCTRTQQRAIMGLLPLVSFGKTVNNFFFITKYVHCSPTCFFFLCVCLCVCIYIYLNQTSACISITWCVGCHLIILSSIWMWTYLSVCEFSIIFQLVIARCPSLVTVGW